MVGYVESPLCYSDGDVMHHIAVVNQCKVIVIPQQLCSGKKTQVLSSSIFCQIPGATMHVCQDINELYPGPEIAKAMGC